MAMWYRSLLSFGLLLVFSLPLWSQGVLVSGRVYAASTPVQFARVTFVNLGDTTIQHVTITDQYGYYQLGIISSLEGNTMKQPLRFVVHQNYPNPFVGRTTIPYELAYESNVQVTIYDMIGREVWSTSCGTQPPGLHYVYWEGKDYGGNPVSKGVYFCRVMVNGRAFVRKLLLSGNSGSTFGITQFQQVPTFLKEQGYGGSTFQRTLYTVRIENTDRTIPYIIPQELQNIYISSDTTVNFFVEYYPTLLIWPDSMRQIIRGFGAANIVGWRPDMTSDEIEKAFGTEDGQIGLSILRLRISPNSNDWSYNVPTAKVACQKGVTLIASPWSPPASMKTNNNLVGGQLREDAYSSYANHLKSFVDYMASQGAPIYAVSVQNEPDIKVTYESCDWYAHQMIKFLKEHGKMLGTKVMAPESYQFRRQLSDSILFDASACGHLDIVCGHIYGGGLFSYPLAEEKGKEVWMTEHLTGSDNTTSPQAWSLAFPVAREIHDVMKARMSAYVWWYIVRYYGPISDGTNNSGLKGEVTKKGYVMSHYARFVRPGYRMVDCTTHPIFNTAIIGTAYIHPETKKLVIVVLNSSTTSSRCSIKLGTTVAATFIPYTTSEVKNCQKGNEFLSANGVLIYTLDPMSITTFVMK
ncbi:MAG: T9SS type A sorting domain-containing protein [Bacteroidetes bacterium]|nr:T9SS type A sorting domain-containing protein [Bacteroidota bacterium]